MLISEIIKRINKLVSNSSSFQLNYNELKHYIDASVDYINLTLKTDMLTPQEQYDKENVHNYINYLLGSYEKLTISDLMLAITEDETNNYNITNSVEFKAYIDATIGNYLEGNNISVTVPITFNYTEMPDNIIRAVLIYYIAASYLEEEDEFESQYRAYINRAQESLQQILKTYYSTYHTHIFDLDKPPIIKVDHYHVHHKEDGSVIVINPYALGDDD